MQSSNRRGQGNNAWRASTKLKAGDGQGNPIYKKTARAGTDPSVEFPGIWYRVSGIPLTLPGKSIVFVGVKNRGGMAAVSRSFHERRGVAEKKEGRDVIHAFLRFPRTNE
jgi:hypothetical protein